MAANFPNSPVEGQEFVAPGGIVYKYEGSVWTMQGTGSMGPTGPEGPTGPQGLPGGAFAAVSDTPPAGATQGQLWWDSSTGNFYIWYDDGTSTQWVQVNSIGVV